MWKGAPGSITASAPSSTSAKTAVSVKAPSVTACRWAKSTTGRTHEACDGRMDGQHDPSGARELAEPLRPGVVHPEFALEVDLAGRVAAFLKERDRRLGAVSRGHASRAEVQLSHVPSVLDRPR